jgi:AraC-like DNA-binding protein
MRVPSAPERQESSTSDFDAAVASLRSVFGDADLRRNDSMHVGLALRSIRADDLDAVRWTVRGVAGASLDHDDDVRSAFLTGLCLGGDVVAWARDSGIDTGRPFIYPDHVNSQFDEVDIANLAVSVDAVTTAARAMTGGLRDDVRFTGTAPLAPALDALWRSTMIHAARTLESLTGCSDVALAQVGLVDHVAMTLLHVFPNTALELEEQQRAGRAQHATLRRALQFIDDNLGSPFTVPQIASAARVSLRGLHALFRRELDTTPMSYVMSARLAAARAELAEADPSTADVAAVAVRWGFADTAGFVRRYRRAFAEHPDETLLS